ncbi:MAG: pitrilysin family protein [bacterium]|nr:pitrilysin family protein [bacterium]
MKEIKVKGVNEVVYYEKLDNKLEVYLYNKEGVSNNYVTFTTKFGASIDNFIPLDKKKYTVVPKGIAHFLEHLLFNQEKNLSPFDFYNNNGAFVNASTNLKYTTYNFSGPTNLEDNIAYLLDFVQSPYFTDELIEKERGIIIQEIGLVKDSPWRVLYEKSIHNAFVSNPVRNSVIGSIKDIKKINKEHLYDCYNTFYNPENMFIVVTGNFDVNKIMNLIKENQAKKKLVQGCEKRIKKFVEKDCVYKDEEVIYMDTDISKVSYNIKLSDANLKGYTKLEVMLYLSILFAILFDDTSKFDEDLKEKFIIDFTTEVEIFNTFSHYLITIVNSTNKSDEFINEIRNCLKNMVITEADFNRKKKVYLSLNMFSFDDIFSINYEIATAVIMFDKYDGNINQVINNLSFEKLNEMIKKLQFNNVNIVKIAKK